MDLVGIIAVQIGYTIASLALISAGLAVIFGMMRVINLAHGEFLMLGAYAVVVSTKAGINFWVSMLVIAPLFVGIVGVIVERFIVPLSVRPHDGHPDCDLGLEPALHRHHHHHIRQCDRERGLRRSAASRSAISPRASTGSSSSSWAFW